MKTELITITDDDIIYFGTDIVVKKIENAIQKYLEEHNLTRNDVVLYEQENYSNGNRIYSIAKKEDYELRC